MIFSYEKGVWHAKKSGKNVKDRLKQAKRRSNRKALKQAIANRPKPRESADAGMVFITKYGLRWGKDTRDNPVTKEMVKVLKKETTFGIGEKTSTDFWYYR